MKIGLANRGNTLLPLLDLKALKRAGLRAVELYVEGSPKGFSECLPQIQKIDQIGLEPVIHLSGENSCLEHECDEIGRFLDLLAEGTPVQTLVFHPRELGSLRQQNQERTCKFAEFLAAYRSIRPGQFRLCLENLPHDEKRPQRFGDNVGEVACLASMVGLPICLDTGHYLAGSQKNRCLPWKEFTSLDGGVIELVGHVHIHAVVRGQDHCPLQEDDGTLAELVRFFRRCNPGYRGIWSIEISPLRDPQQTVLASIETLKSFLS